MQACLFYHPSVPVRADTMEQRRVHDQFSEWVDCGHVDGRRKLAWPGSTMLGSPTRRGAR
jgi:hypothetical protein